MIYLKQLIALVACFGLLGLSGCLNGGNSDLGTVTGVVTVDGEPINYATVTFMPTQGRASVGLTDADGAYNLVYVIGQDGALIGQHSVTVTTRVVKEGSYDDEAEDPKESVRKTGRKELLAKKYCDRNATELTATVKAGKNEIDFDLPTK